MFPRFWLSVLATALSVELLLAGTVLLPDLRSLARDGSAAGHGASIVAVLALAVAIVAGLGVARGCVRAREELERRAQVIAAAASMTHDWMWEADLEGRLTYSSEGVGELLGYRPDEIVGRSSYELLDDEADRSQARQLFSSSRSARAGWDPTEYSWRHRDGSTVRLRGAAVALKDHKGRVVGFRGARRAVSADEGEQQATSAKQRRIDLVLTERAVDMALQPLVSLVGGTVVGVEALARFRDGRGPDQWFSEAHECGRVKELDALTFAAALDMMEQLPESVYLSVNASPELLLDPEFSGRLCASGLPLERLVIEITEHARVPDYPALNAALGGLRKHGVRFAIDDTGAGYASLNHVLQLRPDIIKLDRALITDVSDDPARRALVTALVLLALEVGASVTGEGVETREQLEALATLGVDHAQGYFLARPTTDREEWAQLWDRRWTGPVPVPR